MLVSPFRLPDEGGAGLTIGKCYEVLGIEADCYRILTDPYTPYFPNDPVLYEPDIFKIIDPNEPSFWVNSIGELGERYAYPLSWLRIGFFEDYHDNLQVVIEQFWGELQYYYPITWGQHLS